MLYKLGLWFLGVPRGGGGGVPWAMPEGDTILRTARSLDQALRGRPLHRFQTPRSSGTRGPQPGEVVEGVEARGKHLLIRFSGGLTLHTHLRMAGSWHLYRPGEPWRKPAHLVRALIEVEGFVAVCFSAPVVKLLPTSSLDRDGPLAALGPDLMHAEADLDEALARVRRLADPSTPAGVVLLDQRVTSGIGNVYRSEVLWACSVSPFDPADSLDDDAWRELFATASRLLRANTQTAHRETVPGGLAVYGRAGRACRRCRTAIRSRRLGEQARTVYWCPTCQDGSGETPGRG